MFFVVPIFGHLAAESWYDHAGRWIKMSFAGMNGSTIDYGCRHCGLSDWGMLKK